VVPKIYGSPVSGGIEFQKIDPLLRITRIFADWFENSHKLAKFAAKFLVGGSFPVKNGRATFIYYICRAENDK
jgi:hypothetical protein